MMSESSLLNSVKLIESEEDAAVLIRYCLCGWYRPEMQEVQETDEGIHYGKFQLQDTVEQKILANLLGYEIVKVSEEKFALKRRDEQKQKRTVMTELYYVDREYRDSYYMYYARKHSDYERFTMRIIIFAGDVVSEIAQYQAEKLQKCFIGSCVLRPLQVGAIGRSLISPQYILCQQSKDYYIRTTKYHLTPFGISLDVEAFPYMMQDGETVTCAEVTLIDIFDYFSSQYADYKYLCPSEIQKIVSRHSFERVLPSKGLNYEMLSRVLSDQGFEPKLYMSKQKLATWDIRRCLSRYVESGIPVAVELQDPQTSAYHSVICIGREKRKQAKDVIGSVERQYSLNTGTNRDQNVLHFYDTADSYTEYVVMDDNNIPYQPVQIVPKMIKNEKGTKKKKVYSMGNQIVYGLAAPLHTRMVIDAEQAESLSLTFLATPELNLATLYRNIGPGRIEGADEIYETLGTTKENPLIIRLFLTSAATYRRQRVAATEHPEMKDVYAQLPLPHFVWVCELYTTKSYDQSKAIGEIVLDGTASPNAEQGSIVLMQYPYRLGYKYPDEPSVTLFERLNEVIETWKPFGAFDRNVFKNGLRNQS